MNTFRFKVITHNDNIHHRAIYSTDVVTAYGAVAGEAYPFGIKSILVKANDIPNEHKLNVRETECGGCERIFYEIQMKNGLCAYCLGQIRYEDER